MSQKHVLRFAALVVSLFFGGCVAKFEPRLSSPTSLGSGLPTVKQVQAGLEVSIEEFASANKSRRAFDADIASHGVLPLLLRVENRGGRHYRVDRNEVRAFLDGQPLPPIYGYEAAKESATRDSVGRALVNTAMLGPLAMYFWPVTMSLSAQHTRDINQEIERHFEDMEFTGAMLQPGEAASGFVYYRLPNSSKQLMNLTVEMTVEGNGYEERRSNKMAYKFVFPTLGISGPLFSETSLESNGDH